MQLTHEEAIKEYAAVITEATHEHLAPNWASDLIEGGWGSDHLADMAQRWRDWEFEPADFAARVDLLGHAVQLLEAEGLVNRRG